MINGFTFLEAGAREAAEQEVEDDEMLFDPSLELELRERFPVDLEALSIVNA